MLDFLSDFETASQDILEYVDQEAVSKYGKKDTKSKYFEKWDSLMNFPIRISSPKAEGILQVSKWTKVQILLDADEMRELLDGLGNVYFVAVSEPVKEGVISASDFLEKYSDYIFLLKQGQIPPAEEFRRLFSCAMSTSLDCFYAIALSEGKFLIKPTRPVVQLQAHHFFYSNLDGKFHPMVLSPESISWGLQISYPQLFQDPHTRKVIKVVDSPDFPNSALFLKLLRWMRSFTLPTPFQVGAKRVNAPIRIGKQSLAWIKNHPQLKQRGIQVSL